MSGDANGGAPGGVPLPLGLPPPSSATSPSPGLEVPTLPKGPGVPSLSPSLNLRQATLALPRDLSLDYTRPYLMVYPGLA